VCQTFSTHYDSTRRKGRDMSETQNTTLQVGDIGIWLGKSITVFRVHRTGADFADIEWLWNSGNACESQGHITNLNGGDHTQPRYNKGMVLLHRPNSPQLPTEGEQSLTGGSVTLPHSGTGQYSQRTSTPRGDKT